MEVNERFVKIGKVPIAESLEQGGAFQVKIYEDWLQFEVVKIEHKSNMDGTEDITYILKHDSNP